jgi:hypothetical protein
MQIWDKLSQARCNFRCGGRSACRLEDWMQGESGEEERESVRMRIQSDCA